jgi:Mlc titration factor MtfA (ptsG expression regulator)
VHPGQATTRRVSTDEDGVVHEYDEILAGEAMEGGPVMLSWRDVRGAGASASIGYNVVVHEFAHVLDMAAGLADGVPVLPATIARSDWERTFASEYEALCRRVNEDLPTVLDPYGAQSRTEFFAVASESFFVAAHAMKREHPELFSLLARYYRQDPSATPA